jgi:uncharacterized protein involved in cysteine biosynthesis
MKKILLGVDSFFEGLTYLRKNKSIRNLSFVPAFLCLIFLIGALSLGVLYVDEAFELLAFDWMANLNVFIKTLIYIFSVLTYFVLAYFLVFLIVSIISIPIFDKLAELVCKENNYPIPEVSLGERIKLSVRMIKAGLLKIALVMFIAIFVFISSFFPLLYPGALFLTFIIITWDTMDFVFDLEGYGFRQRVHFLKKHILSISGFALCVGIFLFIPLIHFLLLPIAVIGSTNLFLKLKKQSE